MLRALWMAAALLCGCADELTWVPGSTLRVGEPVNEPRAELEIRVFTERGHCVDAKVAEDEMDRCLPTVDRATGQVRLGFQFRLDSLSFPMPVTTEHVQVYHMGSRVTPGDGKASVEVIPHDPIRASQLFVLVIDGSGSMNTVDPDGETRINKVRQALLNKEVVKGFFPEGVKTGVIVTRFTAGTPEFLGSTNVEIIRKPERYREVIREHLTAKGGYTHLYDAVDWATSTLLSMEEVKTFVALEEAQPTIVALTDGFNNLESTDTCGSNAPRLSRLLRNLRDRRYGEGVSIRSRPVVFTVGLGRPIRRISTVEGEVNTKTADVEARKLCGKQADRRIDGDLERDGIDNASLQWIAAHGGGFSFTRRDAAGLGKAFQAAAAERYEWFELRYSVDSLYLRRAFETTLRLVSFATAEVKVKLAPSPWFDAPTPVPWRDRWTQPAPYRSTAALVLPLLGLGLALSYLGAVLFNTRRALFGRLRRPRAGPAPRAGPVPPSGGPPPAAGGGG